MKSQSALRPGRRVYLAAAFARRAEVAALSRRLGDYRIAVVSTWHTATFDASKQTDGGSVARTAADDLSELRRADVFVVLTQPDDDPLGRGGRHVELGAALAWEIPVVVVGPHEHLFHALACTTFADAAALVADADAGQALAA